MKKGLIIAGRFRISSDEHNYIVERRATVTDQETGESSYKWTKPRYFSDLALALNDIVDDHLLKPKARVNVEEMLARIDKVRRLIKKVGKRCIDHWGA